MKKNWKTRFFALLLCAALLATCFPLTAFAEEADTTIDMIAGDSIVGFVPAGTDCTSADASIAWVDSNGSLNAMKAGTTTVTVSLDESRTEYTVNVSEYSDVVGNLKLLARYNDSMQFYDGHVYLLFTSYQDGVTINVPDLYAGYRIDDSYYKDINEDISNGSNHTGKDAEKYFTFDDEMKSVTLDRGEIVTIGMYRDFDLTVPQAAMGSIKNSSLWNDLVKAGKSGVVETIFKMLDHGQMDFDIAIENIKEILDEEGLDYNALLDGVVDGGVCFNRELYNQKLEWDQYENVTYEMDITENQLNTMAMYLGGNLNNFSILKNSCATVALRAWNAAVGTRNGEPGAYYLDPSGEGIFALVDAPKTVRDSMVDRLPGYYLNNAEGVAEPDAGYQDDTGWVYVSAPEKVAPVILIHDDNTLFIDENKTKAASLINAAKGNTHLTYNKDEQDIDVTFNKNVEDDLTTVNSIDFDVNGTVVTLTEDNINGSFWCKVWIGDANDGENHYVVDENDNAYASEFSDGWLSFCAPTLPFTYKVVGSPDGTKNLLRVNKTGDAQEKTEIYYYDGNDKVMINNAASLNSDTKIFVKPVLDENDKEYITTDITLNGESFFNNENYDADEGAYFTSMPTAYSTLNVKYEKAVMEATGKTILQLREGDVLKAADCAKLFVGDEKAESDKMIWRLISEDEDVIGVNGAELTAKKAGATVARLCAEGNENISVMFVIEVSPADADLVSITYNDDTDHNVMMSYTYEGSENIDIPFSGYMIPRGAELYVFPIPNDGKAVLYLHANDRTIWPDESFTVTEDTVVDIKTADAEIKGMPEKIDLAAKGDTYQLKVKSQYTGFAQLIPMYDSNVYFRSSDDDLVTVDENGLITVTGDVPEDGAVVYVTAYAGSTCGAVNARTKITVGDYAGDKIVGRLTVHARRVSKGELIAHGCITFTTYEDLDLDASYYEYYRPNDKYNDLMIDYEQHPENYTSDPALYEMNELGLENRESYFDVTHNGPLSDPAPISLLAGESFTVSNYGFDSNNIEAVCLALKDSTLYQNSAECRALVYEMEQYMSQGENYDGALTFDALAATLLQIYAISKQTGYNPADNSTNGGACIDRELYNQFRRNDSQMPNNYYTIEINADELAALKAYLADPWNNRYSFMSYNCGTNTVDIWNAVFADKPELQLNGNLSGVAVDPQSLYFEIGALIAKDLAVDLDGYGGTDFYPRTIRYSDATKDAIEKIKAIGTVDSSDECKEKIDAARGAYDALNDSEKARVWNYDTLLAAEEAYAQAKLEADKAEYAEYQENTITIIDWLLADEDDSLICQAMISAAKAAISLRPYDERMTLDENKAEIDTIFMLLAAGLQKQRYAENPKLGDVDLNGDVESIDVTYIQRYSIWMPTPITNNYEAGDIDADGYITIMDATMTQQWLANDVAANENIGQPIH